MCVYQIGRLLLIAIMLLPLSMAEVDAAVYALAGDSTVAPNNGNDGWGDALADFLPPTDTVINRGLNGRSTKTFINEGRWKSVLDLKPDFILIQFGHNDQKIDNPGLGTHAVDNPAGSIPSTTPPAASNLYRENLRRMVDDAVAIGAVPVLVTPVARRSTPYDSAQAQENRNSSKGASDSFGNKYSLLDYANATKVVGEEKDVHVIDLNRLSLELYADMIAKGEDISTLGPSGDNTHFNATGMVRIAELVAGALRTSQAPEPCAAFLCLLSLTGLGGCRTTRGR